MFKKTILIAVLLTMSLGILALSGCTSQSVAANGLSNVTAKQTTIQATLSGSTVSIPAGDVERLVNTRFKVATATGSLSFMAYKYHNQTYVRADICPPCGSQSFTLKNGTLVCDTCGTIFNAATGTGVSGACVKYAKQLVSFQTQDGNIVMNGADLATAFQNTLKPAK